MEKIRMATKKQIVGKRGEMIELIRRHPGISSAELAQRVGISSASKVTTALWQYVRNGKLMTERAEIDGRWMNRHYMADQVPPDAAERINQKLVAAEDVIPMTKSVGARNSVFDVGETTKKKSGGTKVRKLPTSPTQPRPSGFACAVTSDGSLVLIREGQIEISLSGAEAATLQAYLVKRAAASFFANMA
jgi:hypothetical protein